MRANYKQYETKTMKTEKGIANGSSVILAMRSGLSRAFGASRIFCYSLWMTGASAITDASVKPGSFILFRMTHRK
jgi:hypothetical protein